MSLENRDAPTYTKATHSAAPSSSAPSSSADDYSISDESVYYITALVFAGLVTIMLGLLRVSWLLPIAQSVALTIFMFPLIRRGKLKRATGLLFSWLLIQFVIIMFFSVVTPNQMEHTIHDGFTRRTGMLAWFYASDAPPAGLVDGIASRLGEILAIVIGSAVSAGLIGFWLLVRGVNLAAFYAGTILAALSDTASGVGAFPVWTLLRLGGYGLVSILAAGPLLSRSHSLGVYFRRWRSLLFAAIILILLGLIFENTLPNLWRTWFS